MQDFVKQYEPEGEIDFGTAHDEDTKGNADTYYAARLTAQGGKLRLWVSEKRTTIYNTGATQNVSEFEIESQAIIDLIKKHGSRV